MGPIGELFKCVLQHMKCIEVRLDYGRAVTTQKQKYAIGQAMRKVDSAITGLMDLLPDSSAVLQVKKELDKTDLVYVMLLTEKFSQLTQRELEEVDVLLESYIKNKRTIDK